MNSLFFIRQNEDAAALRTNGVNMHATRKAHFVSDGSPYAAVRVIDSATGRGVPCIGLTSTSSTTWFTDSAGIAAVDASSVAAAGAQLWLDISSDGYVAAADGFG